MDTVCLQFEGSVKENIFYLEINKKATFRENRQLLFIKSQVSFYANEGETSGFFFWILLCRTLTNATKYVENMEINIYPD